MSTDFLADLDAIARISVVPTILDVVCRTTGMGFAAVARVTEGRWIACSVKDDIQFGLKPGGELKVETTICNEIRQSGEPVVIDHVAEDNAYCGHPTPALYGFQSYISVPIVRSSGAFFGTLCAIDPRPHRLNTPATVGMFKLFANLIAFHLDAVEQLVSSEATLAAEREQAGLREQFIAVLGHDLRNPLANVIGGLRLLQRRGLEDDAAEIVRLMQGSTARMSALIDNVVDFARGRLGGGFSLQRKRTALEPVLRQVMAELQSTAPERAIEATFAISEPVDCDPVRIAQLFSNLLANALTHGSADALVRVDARTAAGRFTLSVANAGESIPPTALPQIFQPFFRGTPGSRKQGLGLGLYI
ncbi:MAG TPA: GAF domain-containing sensor histidine kinase, partial [Reyranella sp.]|nr:GAF domain-containing sensor histidine kinase [Reyranella sp.]